MGRSNGEFGAGVSGSPLAHHAQMDTPNFSFEGFGATPEEAKRVVAQAFRKHMKQSGVSMSEWKQYTGQPGTSDEHIHDWFGTNVKPVHMGAAYRDGEPLR